MTTKPEPDAPLPTKPEEAAPVSEPRSLLVDHGGNFFDQLLTPSGKDEAWKLCVSIAASDLCPKSYRGKPFDVAIAAALGRRIGLDVMTSLQGIAVVNGNPKLWGDVMWGVVRSQRDLEDCDEVLTESAGTWSWTCTLKRKGKRPVVRTFSREDAKAANLIGKDIWKLYEKRMGQWKARTLCARDCFPEVLAGMVADVDDASSAKPADATVRGGRFTEDRAAEVARFSDDAKPESKTEAK